MQFDPNLSPCRKCEQNFEDISANQDEAKVCVNTCVDLMCWQTARAKAEAAGLPKPGLCAICFSKSESVFCDSCRDRISGKIKNSVQTDHPKRGFKNIKRRTHSGIPDISKYFQITKQGRVSKCWYCQTPVHAGEDVMAKSMSTNKGNYIYLCRPCYDGIVERGKGAKFKIGEWAEWRGYSRLHIAKCVAIIPQGRQWSYAKTKLVGLALKTLWNKNSVRAHESYIFAEPPKGKASVWWAYWPDISVIKKAEATK